MSRRALILPIRAFSLTRTRQTQWLCRRCLATESQPGTSSQVHTPFDQSGTVAFEGSTNQENTPTTRLEPLAEDTLPPGLPHLKKQLPHAVPPQYLQHCSAWALNEEELTSKRSLIPAKVIRGVVVSAGKMHKTVRVRVAGQTWNKRIGKFYDSHTSHLVHDPNSSLIEGDIIAMHRLRVSSEVHHVVGSIQVPFGKPIEDRPPVPTPEERLNEYKGQRFTKLRRRELRAMAATGDQTAIEELRSLGLDQSIPGEDLAATKGKSKEVKRLRSGKLTKREVKAQKLRARTLQNIAKAKGPSEVVEAKGSETDGAIPEK